MSFAALARDIPAAGRVYVKGGMTQGHVEKSKENIIVEKYKPSVGKGSEYAAKFKAEADKAYFEPHKEWNKTEYGIDSHVTLPPLAGQVECGFHTYSAFSAYYKQLMFSTQQDPLCRK
ncbi:hypothetical protein J6590_014423 [Homalodisca vitripennis]|nr:hypothetical protein J6590_014423 [Homalodisca vitripennis]